MLGYHYTLVKNLNSILSVGLLPKPLTDEDITGLSVLYFNLPTEGTHVFLEFHTEYAFMLLAWVALGKNDHNVCLLQVEYDEKDTQQGLSDDDIIFRSTFSVGVNDTPVKLRFDLIFGTIPPENIKVVKTWNLLDYASY
ncbi:hypothetical protein LCGC14_0963880 [marine sediment metagenome]|uniref:Uncharacterized protein n=1 Tax=marine sediment metagenome TaxID=412755 RepID=A0A0F9QWV0_9ZZZZ